MTKRKHPAKTRIVATIDWEGELKAVLKAELKLRRMTYNDLIERLAEMGIRITQQNLRNKISRGTFSAVFLMQCLVAMGCLNLRLGDSDTSATSRSRPKRTDDRLEVADERLPRSALIGTMGELASANRQALADVNRRVPNRMESIDAVLRHRRVPRP